MSTWGELCQKGSFRRSFQYYCSEERLYTNNFVDYDTIYAASLGAGIVILVLVLLITAYFIIQRRKGEAAEED